MPLWCNTMWSRRSAQFAVFWWAVNENSLSVAVVYNSCRVLRSQSFKAPNGGYCCLTPYGLTTSKIRCSCAVLVRTKRKISSIRIMSADKIFKSRYWTEDFCDTSLPMCWCHKSYRQYAPPAGLFSGRLHTKQINRGVKLFNTARGLSKKNCGRIGYYWNTSRALHLEVITLLIAHAETMSLLFYLV